MEKANLWPKPECTRVLGHSLCQLLLSLLPKRTGRKAVPRSDTAVVEKSLKRVGEMGVRMEESTCKEMESQGICGSASRCNHAVAASNHPVDLRVLWKGNNVLAFWITKSSILYFVKTTSNLMCLYYGAPTLSTSDLSMHCTNAQPTKQ